MDIEALKEQWSEVEDRDGLRLSWNVFPSSRMVDMAIPDSCICVLSRTRKRQDLLFPSAHCILL